MNHACGGKPTFVHLSSYYPWFDELWDQWNPVGCRLVSEINHATIAAYDLKKGDMVTDDYSQWDGFMSNRAGKKYLYVDGWDEKWCGPPALKDEEEE
jgi:hypothetical protein